MIKATELMHRVVYSSIVVMQFMCSYAVAFIFGVVAREAVTTLIVLIGTVTVPYIHVSL